MNNTEIVKEAYNNFGSGNIDGLIELFAEDIKWTMPDINGSPFDSVINGRENVRNFFGTLSETEEFTNFEPKEFIADGDKVVVLGSASGKIIPTGRDFEIDWVHIYTVDEGKITNFVEFFDTAEMERAYQRSATA